MYNLLLGSQQQVDTSYFAFFDAVFGSLGIIIIISIIINIVLIYKTVKIAEEKNCSPIIWVLLVLFLGIIPFIILLCLPYPTYTPSSSGYSLTGNNAVNKVWTCKTCGCKNAYNRNYCYNCKNPRVNDVAPVNSGWICPECKTKNNSFASHCSNCFREKP